jgi:predicted transcriptional regulator
VTAAAVKKWKYGETEPRIEIVLRIQEITGDVVMPADWLREASQRAEKVA